MGVTVVGGGLAGSEAAWQAASQGVAVTLHEMRPAQPTAVHQTDRLAELVCSNSFRGDKLDNAVGLLKEEMRRLGSLVMRAAEASRVPAGAALAVDRELFSQTVTESLHGHPLITIVRGEVESIPDSTEREPRDPRHRAADVGGAVGGHRAPRRPGASVLLRRDQPDRAGRVDRSREGVQAVALGSKRPARSRTLRLRLGALSPGRSGLRSRRRGRRLPELSDDPRGVRAVSTTRWCTRSRRRSTTSTRRSSSKGACRSRSWRTGAPDTLRFGPMKPVGLVDPRTGRAPYAAVQLRQDNLAGDHYSLVGFQTQLKWGEQARVLRLIPGLEQAEFVRFGMVHRNTYVNGPTVLADTWQVRRRPSLFFAGQMSGVEGYVESAASGLLAGLNAAALASGRPTAAPPRTTAIGALAFYVSHANPAHYQPSNITFGIMPPLEPRAEAQARAQGGDRRARAWPICGTWIACTQHLKAFLQFLRLNRNASAHTVRAYESDLSQFLDHAAVLAGIKRAALEPVASRSHGDPRLSGRAPQARPVARVGRAQAGGGAHVPALPPPRGPDRRRSGRDRARRRSAKCACRRTCRSRRWPACVTAPASDQPLGAPRSRDPRAVLRVGPSPERARRPRRRRRESQRADGAGARQGREAAAGAVQQEHRDGDPRVPGGSRAAASASVRLEPDATGAPAATSGARTRCS